MKFSWSKTGDYYQTTFNKKTKLIHHFVLGLEGSALVDHIDHIPKNNKIENLRISDYSLNGHNRTKKKRTTSIYIGVHFKNPKWIANIFKDKKIIISFFLKLKSKLQKLIIIKQKNYTVLMQI